MNNAQLLSKPVRLSVMAGLVLATAALAPSALADDPKAAAQPPVPPQPALLAPGTPAPAVNATAHNGEKVDLAKLRGSYVVLYWYPKDDTTGCTKQACDIRDNWDKLKKAGVKVYGVSTQDNTSHQAFAGKYNLPFPLIPDVNGELAKKYGVPVVDGKARRITYLIDKDGKVKHVWPKAATTGHAAEILAVIEGKA
jgi:thioredoxin-dependent peroxiredoxin